jgi:hypothetical protein
MSAGIEVEILGFLARKIIDAYKNPFNNILELFPKKRQLIEEQRKKQVDEIINALSRIKDLGIDLEKYDIYLMNEVDREMKKEYGKIFLVMSFLFTIISFFVVILNARLNWNISEIAITGLIIETPIQFIGILYIIANNLFPKRGS